MLLAVDSSTQTMGLALFDGAQVVGEMIWQTHNRHTVELAPAVDELLKRCEVKAEQMQAVAVALGPGSFTSLRIGLALAKGLALALNIPIVGVPTLDILVAAQQLRDIPLAAVLQAGRNRLAVGWYGATRGRWQAQGEAYPGVRRAECSPTAGLGAQA
jgi:tRNA threonylcarbamoyladenosine biosynthesis protein TsaB